MSSYVRKWTFIKPHDFRKQVLKLPKYLRPKLTIVMRELSVAENPNKLGEKIKLGKLVYYTVELNDSNRLSYDTIFQKHTILIYRVGPHKEVYGKD